MITWVGTSEGVRGRERDTVRKGGEGERTIYIIIKRKRERARLGRAFKLGERELGIRIRNNEKKESERWSLERDRVKRDCEREGERESEREGWGGVQVTLLKIILGCCDQYTEGEKEGERDFLRGCIHSPLRGSSHAHTQTHMHIHTLSCPHAHAHSQT